MTYQETMALLDADRDLLPLPLFDAGLVDTQDQVDPRDVNVDVVVEVLDDAD